MSHTDRVPVDRDLLADHLGGALAGTPDEARVAHLIATDPEWARAASELAGAFDAVATDLGAVGSPPAMPDDVAARLDAVLRSLSPVPSTGIAAAAAASGAGAEAPDLAAAAPHRPAPRRPGQRPADRRPPAGPPTGADRRRRRTRWGAAMAAVTAVVAFAAIGLGPLGLADRLTRGGDDGAGDAALDAPAGAGDGTAPEELDLAPDAERGDEAARPAMTASGLDYRAGSPVLNRDSGEALDQSDRVAPRVQEERPDQPLPTGGTLPEELAPLWVDPDPCLRAVRADYRPAEVDIQLADFASFERRPAVVIWLTADDERQVLVVGPECGQPAAGLDEQHRAELD